MTVKKVTAVAWKLIVFVAGHGAGAAIGRRPRSFYGEFYPAAIFSRI